MAERRGLVGKITERWDLTQVRDASCNVTVPVGGGAAVTAGVASLALGLAADVVWTIADRTLVR